MKRLTEKYFTRVNTFETQILSKPDDNLEVIVVIPVYDEPNVVKTLTSLMQNEFSSFAVELIFVINSSENSTENIKNQNLESILDLKKNFKENKNNNLKIEIIHFPNLKQKKSGVGIARKIGMDEALRRFYVVNKPNGIIVSLDADTTVEKNYFTEIYKHFKNNNTQGANINFKHATSGKEFEENIYKAITVYELYLRYYTEALKFSGFPYFFHTIGSAFCCTAEIYAKQGGMVSNQSGEDFYFLQKIIPVSNYSEIKTTTVHPSPRTTDRVIFGTGVAVKQIIEMYNFDFPTYKLETFKILKEFFEQIDHFFSTTPPYSIQNKILSDFFKLNNFNVKIMEIKKNTNNLLSFRNRFFQWFNAFRVIKFLNLAHQSEYKKSGVIKESTKLLSLKEIDFENNTKELLNIYRKLQM